MRIYIDPAHTPHSPGAVYGGRNEHNDVLLFSGELKKSLCSLGITAEIFTGYSAPPGISEGDAVLIFHRGTSYKTAPKKGISVTVRDDSSACLQYEAFRLLKALERGFGMKYKGVHTASSSFPHRFIERTGTERSFLFELGFIEDSCDNELFEKNLTDASELLAREISEIYKEGKNEDNP